jgi:hypothetical protein
MVCISKWDMYHFFVVLSSFFAIPTNTSHYKLEQEFKQ